MDHFSILARQHNVVIISDKANNLQGPNMCLCAQIPDRVKEILRQTDFHVWYLGIIVTTDALS